VNVIVVLLGESSECAASRSENSTILPVGANPEPVMVTVVPTGPEEGERPVMTGPLFGFTDSFADREEVARWNA